MIDLIWFAFDLPDYQWPGGQILEIVDTTNNKLFFPYEPEKLTWGWVVLSFTSEPVSKCSYFVLIWNLYYLFRSTPTPNLKWLLSHFAFSIVGKLSNAETMFQIILLFFAFLIFRKVNNTWYELSLNLFLRRTYFWSHLNLHVFTTLFL